ncbi:hypothetical protein GF378_00235 [Candidatus Pacearchaeota archaeon]|nr:hypothetical protein [Candidatus Pacearchaeota archaeon]
MALEVGDTVLCTVERIEKTIVFVKIHYKGKELEGSIVTSEVAPGRIRNIRNYVVPKKKIVCKVLRISPNKIELSLRRVTEKEKKQVMEQYKKQKSYINVLKSILGKESGKVLKEIKKNNTVYDFLEKAKENPESLEKIPGVGKGNAEKIINILKKEKEKTHQIKKEFTLTTKSSNGLEEIKKILSEEKTPETKIKYLSKGKYSIEKETTELKKADKELDNILEKIKEKAKESKMDFSAEER